ncbi:MAG: preprotein translocase subunit SecA [Acidobacteria bacterium]|nr:preprotein translocase subunit SecA [Acidobacteriota bacterium]
MSREAAEHGGMRRGSGGLAARLHRAYLRAANIPVEHDLAPYTRALAAVEAVDVRALPDEALRERASRAREQARSGRPPDDLLPEVFAVAREASARLLGMRPFDVQVAAAAALHRGRLAQLATGEGKTLVAVMPAILGALAGRGVHVFTANDYLAERDAGWMGPLYRFFGLEPSFVGQRLPPAERRRAYAADVTYVTAKEAGFDFLRDHTATDPVHLVHRAFNFLIVDEADFILIDEARVPLVIAGAAPDLGVDHQGVAAAARALARGADYDADEYERTVIVTEAGFAHASRLLGADLSAPDQHLLLSALHVALHAQVLLHRDRDYIVRDGRVELVDEFTGRVADNRRWPHGIQSAVEAKEGLEVQPEGRVLGSIPIQHFVRRYPRLAGMTATATPAAEELHEFFGLRTVVFPPHRACVRRDEDDVVFTDREAKTTALVREIREAHAGGRPVLVGTASVAESEALGAALASAGVSCEVLNARYDAREAAIVSRAGAAGAVTISTNMAGRGTDIRLGAGDPGEHARVADLGGLYVIGTNRHESRRIDDQLRGRAGRQGDPGRSRFFVSLQDDLIQRYGVMALIPRRRRPAPQDAAVDDPVVAHEIARAQRIIEGQNFEIRKTLWQYSDMVDEQRRMLYDRRQAFLRDEADPGVCRERAPEHYAALAAAAGEGAVRRAEQRVMVHVLDEAWAEHLALIEDVREGIHLQRYGGRQPLTEFQRQLIDAFDAMMRRAEDQAAEIFARLRLEGGEIDLSAAGIAGSSATWTYLVNDNPFSTLGHSLLASRTLTSAVGILGVVYWPVTLLTVAGVFLRRWRKRRKGSPDGRPHD